MTALMLKASEHYTAGYAASRLGRKEEALGHYSRALALLLEQAAGDDPDPRRTWAAIVKTRIAMSRCFSALGRIREAEEILPPEEAIPVGFDGWYKAALAYLHEARGEYAQALAVCAEALPLLISDSPAFDDPEEWLDVAILSAECMLARGQDDLAARNLIPVLSKYILPGHPLHGRLQVLKALTARPSGGESQP